MSNFVSVIVINYNCFSTLRSCIKSILDSESIGELLLLDNASTDKSMELIREIKDSRLRIIQLEENIGLAAARNLGAIKTSGNYLAFTDADIAVDKHWLQYPCFLLQAHPDFGAVQCNILLRENIDEALNKSKESNTYQPEAPIREKANSYYPYLFPIGAGFVIRRDVWNNVEGFDPSLFIGNDDVDFGIRLWTSGYKVVVSSEGTIYHKFGTLRSQKKISPIFQFYGLRNMLIIWTKNLQTKSITKHIVPFSILFPFMAIRFGGLLGLRGVVSFLRNLPSVLTCRYAIQGSRQIDDKEIIPMMHATGTLPVQLLRTDLHLLLKAFSKYFKSIFKSQNLKV